VPITIISIVKNAKLILDFLLFLLSNKFSIDVNIVMTKARIIVTKISVGVRFIEKYSTYSTLKCKVATIIKAISISKTVWASSGIV